MTERKTQLQRLERLDEVLAVYGADPARWPAGERSGLMRLTRSDRAAGRTLAEAVALEKVLSLAPAGEASDSLKRQIVAAAVAGRTREARIVPLDAAVTRKQGAGKGRAVLWPAAALAASFALGLYLGVGGFGATTLGRALVYAASSNAPDAGEAIELLGASGEHEGLL